MNSLPCGDELGLRGHTSQKREVRVRSGRDLLTASWRLRSLPGASRVRLDVVVHLVRNNEATLLRPVM